MLSYADCCTLTKRLFDPAEKEGYEDNSEGIYKHTLSLKNIMLTAQHIIEDSSSVSKATGADKSDSKQVSKGIILNATVLMIHA